MRSRTVLPLLLLAAGCVKSEPAKSPAADAAAAAPTPAVPDTTPLPTAAGSAQARSDAQKTPAPATPKRTVDTAKVETGGYDKAIKPRFKIDEKTGKIDTIRKP